MLVAAGLGVGPWTVLAQGVGRQLGIGIGAAVVVVSAGVLALWLPLRERPGLGTVLNAALVGPALALALLVLPPTVDPVWQVAQVLAGTALVGLGGALYLTAGLGSGPRDGWMTGIHRRTGLPLVGVRVGLETSALLLGWVLGGSVGVGTVVYAALVGPALGGALRLVRAR